LPLAEALPEVNRANSLKILSSRVVNAFGGFVVVMLLGVFGSQANTHCAEMYGANVVNLEQARFSIERKIALHRWARRAYDACEMGHLNDPKAVFEGLDRSRY
jgi:hypothetical protein